MIFIDTIACSPYCPPSELPQPPIDCKEEIFSGRVSDILFAPCSEVFSEANLSNPAWWAAMTVGVNPLLRTIGKGMGSIEPAGEQKIDKGGCSPFEELRSIDYVLKYRKVIVDKTNQFTTHAFANKLLQGGYKHYNLAARVCDNPDMIIPIGRVTLGKLDNVLPESRSEDMDFKIEFLFRPKVISVPTPILVPGINAILPTY